MKSFNLEPRASKKPNRGYQPPAAKSTAVVPRRKSKIVRGALAFPDTGIRFLPHHWLVFGNSFAPWFDWELEFENFSLYWTGRHEDDPYDKGAYKVDWYEDVWAKYWVANAVYPERIAEHEEKKLNKDLRAIKPSNVEDDVYEAFVAQRLLRRAVVTPRVLQLIEKEAFKANMTLNQALEEMVTRGWTGFDARWVISKQDVYERRKNWGDALCNTNANSSSSKFIINEKGEIDAI